VYCAVELTPVITPDETTTEDGENRILSTRGWND